MSVRRSNRSRNEDSWAAIFGVLLVVLGWQGVFSDLHTAGSYDPNIVLGGASMVFGGMLIGAALSKSAAKRQMESASKKAK